ncbi:MULTISPECIES: MurR/RpiR family transcriptional regulator [Kocuria]|uniref:MurR/RpiR family transcriptional regulator n=1 Tax=Kocuria TaxID=57493 RepID=UPI00065FACC0|nr:MULTISPECIES: MurR/RpiR family transcriptional regulator [Kocuria]MCT1367186.1 MurR/RpiR family transcriptional regulator [Rothia sp. p3-SID1597]RUQ21882.1 MurR/RpiR family transcriptional regulator [Kocuria sp. HSID16901]
MTQIQKENSCEVDVLSVLRGLVPNLSRGPAAVADFLLEDPTRVVPMTVGEVAAHSGTSDASVIRLARAAGCRGFRELRTSLATSLGRSQAVPGDGSYPGGIESVDAPETVIAKLAAIERESITHTQRSLDPEVVFAVAEQLAVARRIVVVGIGASGLVARDLAAKLSRIGLVAHAADEAHAALTLAVLLEPGDVIVGISGSGCTRDVVEALDLASQAGATTVGLTTQPRSPLAEADHVLISVATQEAGLRIGATTSRTGQLFAVDALFTMVYQLREEQSDRALALSREALAPKKSSRTRRPAPHEEPTS